MFLQREITKFTEVNTQSVIADAAMATEANTVPALLAQDVDVTPATPSTAPVDLGPFRFVDLLRTWDLSPKSPLFLLISDGERQAVAVVARSVFAAFQRQIDSDYDVERLVLVRHMGFVPWSREQLPQELATFIVEANGCEALLKLSLMQLRGAAWLGKTNGPRPPRADELGPLPKKGLLSPFRLPSTFPADRPPQFAPVPYSDDENYDENYDDSPVLTEIESVKGATPGAHESQGSSEEQRSSEIYPVEPHAPTPAAFDSDKNFLQLIRFGGKAMEDEDAERPEVLSQLPSQLPSQVQLQFLSQVDASQSPPQMDTESTGLPSMLSADVPSEPSEFFDRDEPWSEDEEKALVYGIVFTQGPNWGQILQLYGAQGSLGDDLKDRSERQMSVKASAIKRGLVRDSKTLPPGFERVSLFSEESQPEAKRFRLDDSPSSAGLSDDPDPGRTTCNDTILNAAGRGGDSPLSSAFRVDAVSLSRVESSFDSRDVVSPISQIHAEISDEGGANDAQRRGTNESSMPASIPSIASPASGDVQESSPVRATLERVVDSSCVDSGATHDELRASNSTSCLVM